MAIAVCGLNHRSAPIEVFEQVAFTPEERSAALAQLTSATAPDGEVVPEAIILSTCNRVELYVTMPNCGQGAEPLARFLADYHGVPLDTVQPYMYGYQGEDAVRHLLSVAAGLDSLIVGEPQILGQVRQAFDDSQRAGAAGPVLSALFRRAIETGKRVHTETGISQGAASVSYATVEVAARHFADLAQCHVLLIGAGKTGQLTAQNLLGRRVRHITVANRSYDHAAQLAAIWNGEAYTLDRLDEILPQVDIVISCTNAPGYVVNREQVRRAVTGRPANRPLLLIDIAVPRDIDPGAAALPGVNVYNVEDLRQVVETNLDERRRAGHQAALIIDEQTADFMAWFRALAVTPVITELRDHAETIRQRELARMRNRLGDLSPEALGIVDMLTQRIINQLLHDPTVRLKEHASHADGPCYARAVRDLFALDDEMDQGQE